MIRPRTPRHNGKVERSHQNDQNRFYSSLKFYSLQDLNLQMKAYLKRSNRIPSIAIQWLSPLEKRKQLTSLKHFNRSLFPNFSLKIFSILFYLFSSHIIYNSTFRDVPSSILFVNQMKRRFCLVLGQNRLND